MLPYISFFGLSINMYYTCYVIGFAMMMVLNITYHSDYRISRLRAVIYTLITYVFGIGGAMMMAKVYNYLYGLKGVEEDGRVAIFGAIVFTPLMLTAAALIEKLFRKLFKIEAKAITISISNNSTENTVQQYFYSYSVRNALDLLTPGIFIILTLAKFGCFMQGCCYGIECGWGVYNVIAGQTVFPVQLFEVASMTVVLIVFFLVKKKGVLKPGMAFPFLTAMYVVTRFIWEFFRYYEDEVRHYWGFLTVTQGFCVVLLLSSIISIICLYKYSRKSGTTESE